MDAGSVLDAAPDALVITDGEGSVVWLNRAAERLFGYERSAAEGREVAELIVPEDLREADRAGIRRVAAGGPVRILGQRVEFPALRADGSEFPVELTVTRSSDSPVRFTAWIRELASPGERSSTLLERAEQAAGLGCWDWDVERDELLWSDNLYRIFGLEPGALVPTPEYVVERTHPDDRARVEREVATLNVTGQMTPLEYRIIQPEGSVAYLLATLAVLDAANGRPTRLIGTVQDITARRTAEREVTAHAAIGRALAEWQSFPESAVALLRGLAEALDFTASALWVEEEERWVRRAAWRAGSLEDDELLDEVLPPQLPGRAGLAARVRREQSPIHDGQAIGLPVMSGSELLAVIGLYSRVHVSVTERLMEALVGIGYEVGQFLAHRRGELVPHAFTRRELEILQLAARGNSGPEIASMLFISPATVKTHFENIYGKLDVSDRAGAVAHALRLGLID